MMKKFLYFFISQYIAGKKETLSVFSNFVDRLSKCQMATSAAVGIINSFLVGTTERETQGVRECVVGPRLTLQFSYVSGSEGKEDDV